jgi:aminoglycoside 2'-N-acetyltransferase I
MNVEFVAAKRMTDRQKQGLQQLRAAVYPPEVIATLPGRFFTWASPQWSVLLWEQDKLVSRAGLLERDILQDGAAKRIGGIGGVMTHPLKQGEGLASRVMREAAERFNTEVEAAYSLLFCRPHLVEFYKRLDWKPFQGKVYVQQPEGRVEFSANGAMVLDGLEQAPLAGSLDLNGLPW